MSCYHPLLADFLGYRDGKPEYKVSGQYVGIKNDPRDKLVPCGHCIGCRLDYSRQWADRMMLELDHTHKAVFLTLTYDDENVPVGEVFDDGRVTLSLYKPDLQLFMKRLRKYFEPTLLRFYAAGEYGDQTHRPHYHAIIFGIDLADFPDKELLGYNEFKQPLFKSDKLARIWSKGHVTLANVSWQTCAYVARYVTKKVNGQQADDVYGAMNILPEFALMSRRPGIAGFYLVDHPDCLEKSRLYISDKYGVDNISSVRLPGYLFEKLELTNPELYNKIKEERAKYAKDKMLLKLRKTDLDLVHYLAVEEGNKLASVQGLIRK